MKEGIRVGLVGEQREVVQPKNLIDFMGPDVPGVLATAWLIWFMEHAARNAILPFMEEGEDSVGTEIDIQHMAPTPVGFEVVCQAKVIQIDGKAITYQIEARDHHEKIGQALHKRYVVRTPRFAEKVTRKAAASA